MPKCGPRCRLAASREGLYPPPPLASRRARCVAGLVPGQAQRAIVPRCRGLAGAHLFAPRLPDSAQTAMLAIPSLLAAMTIAGAFWVGVLAARRLRDWGDGQRALDDGDAPLALAGASGAPSDDAAVRKVRARVADRLGHGRALTVGSGPSAGPRDPSDLAIDGLRCGDVVIVEAGDAAVDGDFVVKGLLRLREGAEVSLVAMLEDAGRKRWLVGAPSRERWLMLEEIEGHALSGEPPRNLQPRRGSDHPRAQEVYTLERRGQASVAMVGQHARPAGQTRVGTYVYRANQARHVLWVERWGSEIRMGDGIDMPSHLVTFLPGS